VKRIDEIVPRGLSASQASSYWGVSIATFNKLIDRGIAPRAIEIPGLDRKFWYRDDLDRAMDAVRDGVAA
jgi:hypothetical protein